MRVRLLISRAGHNEHGTPYQEPAGSIVDVDDDEGRRMVAVGAAEPITDRVETGMMESPGRDKRQNRAMRTGVAI